ncbi:phage tail protein I [Lysobacter sp. CA199]|uniref:phage tail protein I n=1 Tax=Lysobacter sp. CA199 TaxID=3455608 RepID=UPI003F8D750D
MADAALLPPPLAQDERSQAIALLASRLQGIDLTPVLVYLIDTVNASALPVLGEQFHVMGFEGWLFADTDLARRRLLKRAIELHRYKGTRWALNQVLVTLGLDGRIREWFEYGGDPFRFQVEIDLVSRGIDEDAYNALLALIDEYKNVRSHLDALRLYLTNRSPIPTLASVVLAGEITTVLPYELTHLEQHSPLWLGAALWGVETAIVFPYQE